MIPNVLKEFFSVLPTFYVFWSVVREIPHNTHSLASEPVTAFAPPACNDNGAACPEFTQL